MAPLEVLQAVLGWMAAPGIVIAALTFAASRWKERVDRRRKLFADALVAVSRYKEFAFVISRREASNPAGERQRISTELREVQADLAFYEAWIATETVDVAARFSELLGETRKIAGGLMRDAWQAPAISEDSAMNQPEIGKALAELKTYEDAYIASVRRELSMWKKLPGR